jgi:rhodanese-related sulfurtransferase
MTNITKITVQELQNWLQDKTKAQPVVLDVRESWELETASLKQTTDLTVELKHIPMRQIPSMIGELKEVLADTPVVCMCHHGGRSLQTASFLEHNGFNHIFNVTGGIHAWATEIDSTIATY